jgi:hypothetical protein
LRQLRKQSGAVALPDNKIVFWPQGLSIGAV